MAYPVQNEPLYPTIEYIKTFEKSELKQSLEFAKGYSSFYPYHRIAVENFSDSQGIEIAKGSNRFPDDKEIYLFIGGKLQEVSK